MNFYQATYRAHVTYTDFRGREMRGCYFVRSETNSRLMSLTANMLPEFRAHHCQTCPIFMALQDGQLVLSVDSGADPAGKVVLVLDASRPLEGMPPTSVFPSVKAAYDFLVDFYDAFAFAPETNEVLLLEIERGPGRSRWCRRSITISVTSATAPSPRGVPSWTAFSISATFPIAGCRCCGKSGTPAGLNSPLVHEPQTGTRFATFPGAQPVSREAAMTPATCAKGPATPHQ